MDIHAELDGVVLALECVIEGWRRRGRVEVRGTPPCVLVLQENRHRISEQTPRPRLIFAAETEREAGCRHIAQSC
jgi:hypothetical protein